MDRPPLDAARLRGHLDDGALWRSLQLHESIESTNAEVAALAAAGAAEGAVVTTELQTAGRGRADRSWVSPPRAGIAVSVLLRPTAPLARWSWLPILAGVALAETVERHGQIPALLKWPNDLLLGQPPVKSAGILAEIASGAVALGIGVNVSLTRSELPRPDATSLALAGSACVDRTTLLIALLDSLESWYVRWQAAQGDPESSGLADRYRRQCHTLGRQVTVSMPGGGTIKGLAAAIDNDGRLCVDTVTGRIPVAAGDVHHVR